MLHSSNHTQISYQDLVRLNKIDLHRHLEGSLRLKTLVKIAQKYQLDVPAKNIETLRPHVQVTNETPNYKSFLDKFLILRQFYSSPEIICQFVEEAIADAAADNILYLELRFSPQALASPRQFSLEAVTDWVINATRKASAKYNIHVNLLVSLLRHESLELAEKVAQIAVDRREKGIVGIDLAGDEAKYSAAPFIGVFREVKQEGLHITVHAGEGAGAQSVRSAIEELGADRIGHGVRTVEDSSVIALVKERQITLEVCLTSNWQTGVIQHLIHHPLLTLLDEEVPVTLNTDDPQVSNTLLTQEYYLALTKIGLNWSTLHQMIKQSIRATFLPPQQKKQLIAQIEKTFPN